MTEIQDGIYVEVVSSTIGTGGTAKKQEITNYYKAESVGNGLIQIQLLDMNGDPLQIFEQVESADFQRRFRVAPDFSKTRRTSQEIKVDKAIAQAEVHVRRKELFSAEFEYNKALKLDEENVRANFGVGKVYLLQGDREKAREAFERLTNIDAVFDAENKYIFNELGIELRRMGLYDQAIAHYAKALSFAPDDENLHFNIGRACFEQGDPESAGKHLRQALTLNPDLQEAKQLQDVILSRQGE